LLLTLLLLLQLQLLTLLLLLQLLPLLLLSNLLLKKADLRVGFFTPIIFQMHFKCISNSALPRKPGFADSVRISPFSNSSLYKNNYMRKGITLAICSYLTWGLFPIYFKSLANVPPPEILANRILWAMPFLLLVLAGRSQWSWLATLLNRPKVLAGFIVSAVLLSLNWLLYIWAVNNGRIIDGSLGYFINPIVNVLLGFILLKERLRVVQWCAVAIAASGVIWLAVLNGHMPWISLALALSFGCYALMRKTAALGALEGLTLETMILFPCALAYVVYLYTQDANTFTSSVTAGTVTPWLLIAGGPITAIPLLAFSFAARRIPMSTLGILQYISPSIQLLIGIWIYHEPFSPQRLAGFVIIWSALLLYSAEGLWRGYQLKMAS
jgi:chloramphenicol-sensitive protein RarD